MALAEPAGAVPFATAGPPPVLVVANGRRPVVHPGAFVAAGAILVGDVVVEEGANIWFGVVLRADLGRILVGPGTNVQDGTVAHADESGLILGEDVTVGHRCLLHGRSVGDGTLIGMGATLLGESRVGAGCVIGAGTLVTERTVIPDGKKAWGAPASVRGEVGADERASLRHLAALCRAEIDAFQSDFRPTECGCSNAASNPSWKWNLRLR